MAEPIKKTSKPKVPTWDQVVQDKDYVGLNADQRNEFKELYFNKIILPKTPDNQIGAAKAEFFEFAEAADKVLSPIKKREAGPREILSGSPDPSLPGKEALQSTLTGFRSASANLMNIMANIPLLGRLLAEASNARMKKLPKDFVKEENFESESMTDSFVHGLKEAEETFRNLAESTDPDSEEYAAAQKDFLGKIMFGIGSAPVAIVEFLMSSTLLGPVLGPHAAMAMVGALSKVDKGAAESAKEAIKGFLLQKTLQFSGKFKGLTKKGAIAGGAFGTESLVSGGSVEDIAAASATGVLLSSIPEGKSEKFNLIREQRAQELIRRKFNNPIDRSEPSTEGLKDTTDMIERSRKIVRGEKVKDPVDSAIKENEKLNKLITDITSWESEAKRLLTDELEPVVVLERNAEQILDRKLSPEERPIENARLYNGNRQIQERMIKDFAGIIKPVKHLLPELESLLLLKRFRERAQQGMKNPRKMTLKKTEAAISELRHRLGDNFEEIDAVTEQIYDFAKRNFLEKGVKSGVLSQEAMSEIEAKNENYSPLDVMEHVHENIKFQRPGSKSFNVAKQDIFKKQVGTEKEVAAPLDAYMRKIMRSNMLFQRNEVARGIGKLMDVVPELVPVKPVDVTEVRITKDGKKTVINRKEFKNIPKGFDKIQYLDAGAVKETVVPQGVADALKGLNKHQSDFISRWAARSSSLVRAGATTFNAPFIISNAIRDYQTAKLVATTGFNMKDWVGGFIDVALGKEILAEFERSGAGQGGYFGNTLRPELTLERALKSKAQRLKEDLFSPKIILTPFEAIRIMGEIIELTPRVGVFKRGLKQGLTKKEAAVAARSATIDFAKGGEITKTINNFIPFINARVQGTTNLLRAFKTNPKQAALTSAYVVGLPTISMYLYNRSFWNEEYEEIPQGDKDNNFPLIFGSTRDKITGKIKEVKYLKIPKGDAGRLIGNPIEAVLNTLFNFNRKSFQELTTGFLSDLSPIPLLRDGEFSLGAALSGGLPPVVKTAAEAETNKNFFTDRPLVPRKLENVSPELQFTKRTSEFAKFIGGIAGLSPIKIDHVLRGLSGGLISQIVSPTESANRLIRRFYAVRGGASTQRLYKKLDDIMVRSNDKKLLLDIEAEQIASMIKDKDRFTSSKEIEELKNQVKAKGPAFEKLVKQKMLENLTDVNGFDRFMSTRSNKDKAQLIFDEIKEMDNLEEQLIFINGFLAKKVRGRSVISQDLARGLMKIAIKSEVARRAKRRKKK